VILTISFPMSMLNLEKVVYCFRAHNHALHTAKTK
jgi:hypothetical protein